MTSTTTSGRIRRVILVQTLAILLLVGAGGWLWYSAAVDRASRDADRAAAELDQQTRDAEDVADCYSSIGRSRQVSDLLSGLEVVLDNQIRGAREAIEADPDSPLTPTRERTIAKALPALRSTRDFIAQTEAETPTRDQCAALRCKLTARRTQEPLSPTCRQLLRLHPATAQPRR